MDVEGIAIVWKMVWVVFYWNCSFFCSKNYHWIKMQNFWWALFLILVLIIITFFSLIIPLPFSPFHVFIHCRFFFISSTITLHFYIMFVAIFMARCTITAIGNTFFIMLCQYTIFGMFVATITGVSAIVIIGMAFTAIVIYLLVISIYWLIMAGYTIILISGLYGKMWLAAIKVADEIKATVLLPNCSWCFLLPLPILACWWQAIYLELVLPPKAEWHCKH